MTITEMDDYRAMGYTAFGLGERTPPAELTFEQAFQWEGGWHDALFAMEDVAS